MSSQFKITANVIRREGLFVATTARFPYAEGRGVTRQEALDELRRALKENTVPVSRLKGHPLCPAILEWFHSTTGPAMPFLPESKFIATLEALWLDPVVSQQILQTYRETAILGYALVGGVYDQGIHEALYTAAEHSLGFDLAHAAGLASRLGISAFAQFSVSTQYPGFLIALEAWAKANGLGKPFDGAKELRWINRNLVAQEQPSAAFWQNACQGGFESLAAFNKALSQEGSRFEAATRDEVKRRADGVIEKEAEYLNFIKLLWVPASLWILDDASIVATLTPEKKDEMNKAYGIVRRNISALGFTKSRLGAA